MSWWHKSHARAARPRAVAGSVRITVVALMLAALLALPARSSATSVRALAPYHFAVLASFTGPFSDVGQAMWEGAKAGELAVNASGGIMGHKLIVDLVDTVGDPADAVTALNKEIAFNHPIGCVGPTTSEIFGIKSILDRNHLPFMFEGGSTVFDTNTDKYLWRSNPSDSQLGVAMAAWALKTHYKTAALMFSVEQSAQTLTVPLQKTFKKNGGKVVAVVQLAIGQTSYRSEVTKVVNAHPQVIFIQTEPTSAGALFSNFKELNGLRTPFIGTDLTGGSDFIKAVTPQVAHAHLVSAVGSSAPGGGATYFNQFYAKAWHHQPKASANYAYDGAVDLALAIDKAGSTNPDKIVAAIPAVSNPPGTKVYSYAQGVAALKKGTKINYDGASGPTDYNMNHNVLGPFDIVQAQTDGSLKTLYTFSAAQLGKVIAGKGV